MLTLLGLFIVLANLCKEEICEVIDICLSYAEEIPVPHPV